MLGLSMYDRREIAYINRLLGPFAILGWIVYLFVHVIIPKSRVVFPWLFLLLIVACGEPFAPPNAVQFDPPAVYAELWQQVESCSGKTGDWHRITWLAVPTEQFDTPEGFAAGRWQPQHIVYLSDAGQRSYATIKHEMLHDLLQTGEHPPVFDVCGVR